MCRIKRGGPLQGVAHFPGGQLNNNNCHRDTETGIYNKESLVLLLGDLVTKAYILDR
jgi:hypothetical protein